MEKPKQLKINLSIVRFLMVSNCTGIFSTTGVVSMKRLIADSEPKVFLILDNPPLHHVNDVRGWLEAHKHEIEVLYLPAYSPKLNLDEYLNSDLKAGVLSRPARASMSG